MDASSPLVALTGPGSFLANLVVDGDISEWGSLFPAEQTDEKRLEAPSSMSLQLAKDGLYLAAKLDGPSRDGVWLGIAFAQIALPQLSPYWAGGDLMEASSCDTQLEKAACLRAVGRIESFMKEQSRRFFKLYQLDPRGVVLVDGALREPILGAKVASKVGPSGVTVEAFLPNRVLPRMSFSPLGFFGALSLASSSPSPERDGIIEGTWESIGVPEPIEYAPPYDELRARLLQTVAIPNGLSYHPDEPNVIETVVPISSGPKAPGFEPVAQRLFVSKAKLGDLEIGYGLRGNRTGTLPHNLVVLKGTHVVAYDMLDVLEPIGVVKRGAGLRVNEVHVIAYREAVEPSQSTTATYRVLSIGPDGKIKDVLPQTQVGGEWSTVKAFHDEEFLAFGVKGVEKGSGKAVEMGFVYDAGTGKYMAMTKP